VFVTFEVEAVTGDVQFMYSVQVTVKQSIAILKLVTKQSSRKVYMLFLYLRMGSSSTASVFS